MLIVFFASSSSTLVLAIASWWIKYPLRDVKTNLFPLLGILFFVFFVVYLLIPSARVFFIYFFVLSRPAKFLSKVNSHFGVLRPEIALSISFIYLFCERAPNVLLYWDAVDQTYYTLFLISLVRVFVLVPTTIQIALEKMILQTPSVFHADKKKNFFMVGVEIPGASQAGRTVGKILGQVSEYVAGKKPTVPELSPSATGSTMIEKGVSVVKTAGTAGVAVLSIIFATQAQGDATIAQLDSELKETQKKIETVIEKHPKLKTVGEQELEKIRAEQTECKEANRVLQGAEVIYRSTKGIFTEEDPRTQLQKKVHQRCEQGYSFASGRK